MALTKVGKEGITGVSNASNATFLTATAAEGVTLAGTLAVTGVHTVGTNAVATSEGGAATSIISQGLSKAWINCNGQSTVAIRDSFNITSITDNGTGDTSVTIANNMGNGNYCPTMGVANYNGGQDGRFIVQLKTTTDNDWTTIAVSSIRVMSKEVANSTNFADASLITISMDGDLA